jgi:hypothetical protein
MIKLKDFIIWFVNSPELHPPVLRFTLLIIAIQYIINSFFYSLGDYSAVLFIKGLLTALNAYVFALFINTIIQMYKDEDIWKNL